MRLTKIKIGGQVLAAALAAATLVNCPQPTDEPTNPNNGKKDCTCPNGTEHEFGAECCDANDCECTFKPDPNLPTECDCPNGTVHPEGKTCECDADDCECIEEVLVGHFGDEEKQIPVYQFDATDEQVSKALASLQKSFNAQGPLTKGTLRLNVKRVNVTNAGMNSVVREGGQVIGNLGWSHDEGGYLISAMLAYINDPTIEPIELDFSAMPRQFITPKQLLGLEKRFNAVKQMAVVNRRFMFQPQRMS